MEPLLITHAEDPDGKIARALLMRYFGVSRNPEDHVFVRYDRIVESFQEAQRKAKDHKSIFIADIDINGRLYAAATASSLFEKLSEGRNAFWFDHHDGTLNHRDELAAAGINLFHNANQCAALLIAQTLFLKDPYDRKLAKIAQAHDYKKTSTEARNIQIGNELEKIIAVANENLDYDLLLQLSGDLAEEKCFGGRYNLRSEWQQYVEKFNQREQEAYKDLDHNVEISKVGPYRVLFGYSSSLLSQKPGPFHLREKFEKDSDIFVCLFKSPVRNHLVLTNKDVSFPAVPFVQSLGGGGRGNGGGFTLDYDITPNNYQNVKEMLISQIEKYSQSNPA